MTQSQQPSLEDLIGIEHSKLGFFQELRGKLEELQASNRKSEQRRQEIAAILDGITDIMMVLSSDLRIISVNHVFRELFDDLPHPEGMYCYEIFRDESRPCPECPAHKSFRTGTVCRETAIFKVGGRNRQFEMVASPILTPDRTQRRILIFKRDVTMEKEYRAKFYQAEKMATIGVLAAGVAHEINNPLAAISGFAEGLKRRLPVIEGRIAEETFEDVQDYVDTILKECRRCQEIVHTLLTFSRPVSSGFFPINLNSIVKDTLKLLQSNIKSRNIPLDRLRQSLHESLPTICADEPQLKQVLLNLLTNALDAIQESGSIVIRTYPTGDGGVGLDVEDTGCGIPPENLDKLFEPFFTTKPVGKGTGIGLSTCYNIVQEHHGEITLRSEPGRGSCFTVKLPATPNEPHE